MHRRIIAFLMGAGLVLIYLSFSPAQSSAEDVVFEHPDIPAQDGGDSDDINVTGDNSYCLLCHSRENFVLELEGGGQLDLHVSPDALANSVHNELGCVDCHGEDAFPHVGEPPTDARLYSIVTTTICTTCHEEQSESLVDGVHARGLATGNLRAAVCTDCHSAHDVQEIENEPQLAAQVCGTCHTTVFAEYEESVHGQALLVNNDTNAPTCIDCHGVHGINRPTTAQARNRSPELCAKCHADEDLMEEYGITTNVFNSYLSDFHGTTVAMFEQADPNVATNKAVCYDCHGVHNITPADDTKSQVAKENLLATCQQCHPDATTDFPDAWVGHFEPTAEDNPLIFGVNWFYRLFIPTVLGGFAVLVASDIFSKVRRTRFGQSHEHTDEGGDNGDD